MLKATIDKSGELWLARNTPGNWRKAFCPQFNGEDASPCGHWCPLFGEPLEWGYDKDGRERMRLVICEGTRFHVVDDARPQVEG